MPVLVTDDGVVMLPILGNVQIFVTLLGAACSAVLHSIHDRVLHHSVLASAHRLYLTKLYRVEELTIFIVAIIIVSSTLDSFLLIKFVVVVVVILSPLNAVS
jgi:hypothetical protein